jgi:mono/diheme cytochrome c family protein
MGLLLVFCISALAFALAAGVGDGHWRTKVPERDRLRQNPVADDAESMAAGAKLFRMFCASCHGSDARGRNRRPDLHSDHVREATPGELEWLLRNGSLKNGMPSWSRLPEAQRWQLVTFLKSIS